MGGVDARIIESSARWRPTLVAWAAIAAAVAVIMLPALFRAPMAHDSFWIDRVWASQFTALLGEGTLYPRWLPWSHEGLGSPVFYYYPPLAFYVTGAFGLAGLSTYGSVVAAFALAFTVSGLGAYHWLREQTSHPLLGALFYILAPYHVFDFYLRGALAESVAIAILPFLAIGLRRIAQGGSWVLAAAAYAAIILSHLPLALLTSVFFLAPYALFHRRKLLAFVTGAAVGTGLAAIYLLPALGLGPYRDIEQLWAIPHLRPDYWSIYRTDWRLLYVFYIYVTIATLAVTGLVVSLASRDRWSLYALAVLMLAMGIVPFVWSLPLLRDVQFPYRVLPLAELGLATAIASARLSVITRAATLPLPLVWSLTMTQLHADTSPPRVMQIERHIDVTEYLPREAQGPGPRAPWLEEPRRGRIPPPVVEGWIVRPIFYFPAWSCGVPEPKTKLLMHRPGCEPELRLTMQEKIGSLISLAALVLLLFQGLRSRRRGRPAA